MQSAPAVSQIPTNSASIRTAELFKEQQQSIVKHTDLLFARLMICQWLAGVAAALLISPRTWIGLQSQTHVHVWAAILLGGIVTSLPVWLALRQPGQVSTRHAVAVGQMLMSALLIHLTGGRIETHFHVFGSLAILAFYRDWRVLISASAVVYADHLLRGFFWPQSVYGVLAAPIWRSLEHAGWVIFEVAFLMISIRKSRSEMLVVAERQSGLESMKETIEQTVAERTVDLTREIAERREAEKSLKLSQEQLAHAQQIARLGSWEWDIIPNKVTWSEETRRLYGFAPEDSGCVMEESWKRVHPDDRAKVKEALDQSVQRNQPYNCEHRVLLPDGTERIMQGRAEIVLNESGKAIKMIGTTQDVTETRQATEALRRTEEQFRQSQKMEAVGRLAGGVAHDFNNLLTVIGGYSSVMQLKIGANDPLQRIASEIGQAAERAGGLTRQLLALSRKQVLQPRVLDLNEVVTGMGRMLQRLIGENIELRTVFDHSLGHVLADPGQIEQVILNMAVNARDAMPNGGKLTISTSNVTLDQKTMFRNRGLEVGHYVMLAISDSGVGMSEEVKAHLFEPFFTTKGVDKGTGLGLATCYGIICQSGGDVRVYSEPNRGTTFKVYLPRTNQSQESLVAIQDSKTLPTGTESILIVEDDFSVRRLAAMILSECGYKVQEACNAAEALALVEKKVRFDLVITDVIMPQMSGKELYDRLKVIVPKTKVLFMSGYTDDALAHHGVLEAGLSFLEKPFSPVRLARSVREILDQASAGKNGKE
ncbi:MAG: Blue-light-activated protein [Verrucomicrobiales bacterium]|nr:Blue-light-activated protein [Verrucomicrobiales bacterium]